MRSDLWSEYVEKLARTTCQRLITNARWGMGVEVIDVRAPRVEYARLSVGWYGCACGVVGFKEGGLTDFESFSEVVHCPRCCIH